MNLRENAYKPISFWSWNGLMEEKELRWQIREFKEKGFGGFFIHSRAGRLIPYMGAQWIASCKVAVDEAEKQGLYVWLYDEDGWPSGFAGGLVNGSGREYWARTLRFETEMPEGSKKEVLCAYKRDLKGYRIAEKEEEPDLYCVQELIPTYVDLMNPNVTKEFLRVTHEVYKEHFGKYFGSVIKGIFTDEPQLLGEFPWSEYLEQLYYKEYGGNLREVLWCLNEAEGYYEIKYRYRKLTNRLMSESFVRAVNEWCRHNGLALTGHFGGEDGLIGQIGSNCGVMPFYRDMGIPGIDHLGNRFASVNLMKQVTSVAHRKNLPYVLSESFGCSGWNISFKDLISVAGWQGVFGVNTLCAHLSAYSILGRRKRDYPAFFSYQEPWWQDCRLLNEAITKLNGYLSNGKRLTHVAVLHPIASAWCLGTKAGKFISSEFRELQNHLVDLHIDYDLIDETELADAQTQNGVLKAGCIDYRLLIVPHSFTLSADTVKILKAFSESGGTVYFIGERPQTVDGLSDHELLPLLKSIKAEDIQNSRTILQKVFRANPVERPYDLLDDRFENEAEGLACCYVKNNEGAYLYCFNHGRGAEITANFRHAGLCKISKIPLFASEASEIPLEFDGEYTYCKFKIKSGCGALFEITENVQSEAEEPKSVVSYTLSPVRVEPLCENCLTLDMGRISLFGEDYTEERCIIRCTDEIYHRMADFGAEATLLIKYRFIADFKKIPERIFLAYEQDRYVSATLNGRELGKETGWFVDKGILKFDIRQLVRNGENEIVLRYIIPNTHKVNDLEDKFESERNRFFYNVEPENIYIVGDFDVVCTGKISENPNYITVKPKNNDTFILKDKTRKYHGELTGQGLWFYRGDAVYDVDIEYRNNGRYYLSVEDLKGVFAAVCMGERELGCLVCPDDRVDLTDYLSYGDNKLRIELRGSNRNLLGPHHHITGEPNFVGPDTFVGVYGFEDFITPEVSGGSTYTDNYSFVPFGIGKIVLTIEGYNAEGAVK